MKTIFLDGDMSSAEAVFDRLAVYLEFPPHAGRNLDAFWDVLRTDVPGPFEIVWRDHATARERLAASYDKLITLFEQLAAERRDFRLVLD
jgi:ribonuclease inhibitor